MNNSQEIKSTAGIKGRIRLLVVVVCIIGLASVISGQSNGTFQLSPSTISGGGNTTANGTLSLTGSIGQSPIGTLGRGHFTIIGGVFGPQSTPFMYGDVNSDHIVNVVDLVAMANFLAGNTPLNSPSFNRAASDLNLDGVVNVADLVSLANFLAGNTSLPVQ